MVGTNLLANEGFENGNDGNWFGSGAIVNDPADSHWESQYCAKLGTGVAEETQSVGAEPAKLYNLSTWLKATENDGAGQLGVQMFDVNDNQITYDWPAINMPASGAGTYALYSLSFITPPNVVTMRPYIYKAAGAGGYVYMDDAILTVGPTNILQNPDFDGSVATWWTTSGSAAIASTAGNSHWTGPHYMQIGTAAGEAYQDAYALANTSYTLTGWCNQTVNDGAGVIGVYALNSAGTQISGFSESATLSGTGYAPYTFTFTTPANTAYIQVYVSKSAGQGGYVYADDMCLTRN